MAQCRRFKEPLPDRIKNKPRLGVGLELFIDAFFDLEHDRPWIAGGAAIPLPITWTAINSYAQYHEINGIMYDDLVYFIRELDTAYIKYLTRKAR